MKPDPILLEGTDLNGAALIELFRQMLRVRLIEESIAKRYSDQEMRCPVHLSVGQEAAAVGSCAALAPSDRLVTTHRGHGHYLAKGGDLTRMLAELHGRMTGCCGGRGGSMHLFDDDVGVMASVPIVGSNVPLGVGIALAFKQRAEPHVAVAYFGDGALEEGVLHESANLAAVLRLPVVFFLENNFYSVYTRLEDRQPRRSLGSFAQGHGLPLLEADGNDVLAVRSAMIEAVGRARAGDGPSFVVVETYRWLEHCGPNFDDDLGYRPDGEFERWKGRCPVARMQTALLAEGFMQQTDVERMAAEIDSEIQTAFEHALAAPLPDGSTASDRVYA